MTKDNANYLRSVREQYEQYPYPQRNPEDERRFLCWTNIDSLGKISHYCHRGRKDLRDGCRLLVAGGGTGDAVIYLGEQLRGTTSELVYLDISTASMEVAKKRAEVRGLSNIEWVSGSILDLPGLGLGVFDYVNCSGVLHHLEDPGEGLRALISVLADGGCLGLMVYGLYGRTGVYQVQDLMRMVNAGEEDMQRRVDNTRRVLKQLPPSNWYRLGEPAWDEEVLKYSDISLYDLFLHAQDRAYSVPQLYEWLDSCGLTLQAFSGAPGARLQYEPGRMVRDAELGKMLLRMTPREQHAVGELMVGSIRKHTFYATTTGESRVADTGDRELVPYFTQPDIDGRSLARACEQGAGRALTIELKQHQVRFSIRPDPVSPFLFRNIDGKATLEEVFARTAVDVESAVGHKTGVDEIKSVFDACYDMFNAFDLLLLRHHSVRPYAYLGELHAAGSGGG